MKSKSLGLWIVTMAGILAVIAMPVATASAEEPEPARTEEPQTTETSAAAETPEGAPTLGSGAKANDAVIVSSGSAKKPRSLADLAAGIDLTAPQGEGSEGIVITNDNLQSMGQGAVVSHGSNMGGASSSAPWYTPPSRGGEPPSDDDIEAARRDVERLEGQASAVDQAVEENKAVNLFNGGGPQYRAPGQTDPLRNQQEQVNKQLADARAKLSAMEKAADKAGGSGATTASPAPQPSSAGNGGQ